MLVANPPTAFFHFFNGRNGKPFIDGHAHVMGLSTPVHTFNFQSLQQFKDAWSLILPRSLILVVDSIHLNLIQKKVALGQKIFPAGTSSIICKWPRCGDRCPFQAQISWKHFPEYFSLPDYVKIFPSLDQQRGYRFSIPFHIQDALQWNCWYPGKAGKERLKRWNWKKNLAL